jgi:hypothetical protein
MTVIVGWDKQVHTGGHGIGGRGLLLLRLPAIEAAFYNESPKNNPIYNAGRTPQSKTDANYLSPNWRVFPTVRHTGFKT